MLQRLIPAKFSDVKVIFILIALFSMSSCGTHYAAQVSDRDPPPSRRIAVHQVAKGDTLFSIAWRYGKDYRDLAHYNRIAAPYTIYPGQTIRLTAPSGTTAVAGSTSALPATQPPVTRTTPKTTTARTPPPVTTPPRVLPPVNTTSRSETKATSPPPRTRQPLVLGAPQWQWPVQGRVLRGFANSSSNGRGIDIAGQRGDPVYAAADGEVVYAGRGIQGAGDLIILRHGARLLSAYMHNSTMLVAEGARIVLTSGGTGVAVSGADCNRTAGALSRAVRVSATSIDA